jgi:hypothetical protein
MAGNSLLLAVPQGECLDNVSKWATTAFDKIP